MYKRLRPENDRKMVCESWNRLQQIKRNSQNIGCTYYISKNKLMHKHTFTNELLYIMNIKDSCECPLCRYASETIKHALTVRYSTASSGWSLA